jgi:hypothetical protein
LHELNINPQAVNEINMNYLFSAAELSLAANGFSGDNRYTDWRTNIGLCGGYVQQLTTFDRDISSSGNRYSHNEESVQCIFEFSYNDQLKNLAEVIRQTGPGGFEEGERVNTHHAARIIRVLSFGRVTDFYGAVPYFEANRGLEGPDYFFPHYDNQSAIYPDLLNELEEAAQGMSTSNADDGFTAADMIYKGDIAKWKRWAYSLMLRYAMRISNVDPGTAATYVGKAVAGGVFNSNADNVWIPMSIGPSEWTNQNGISRAFYPGDGGNTSTLGEPLVDFLKGLNPNDPADDDPRLFVLGGGLAQWSASAWTPAANGSDPLAQRGVPPGYTYTEVGQLLGLPVDYNIYDNFTRINFLMMQDDDPYMIMNYAEVEFLLAEAAERGIGGVTNAAGHYNNGVRAAMQMYTPFDPSLVVTDAQVDAYLARYPYGGGGVPVPRVGGGSTNLDMIATQLWVSHFLNWYNAWNDYRRLDMPKLKQFTTSQSPVTNNPNLAPVRLPYPNIEVASNINFSQGAHNNYVDKVWWDGGTE